MEVDLKNSNKVINMKVIIKIIHQDYKNKVEQEVNFYIEKLVQDNYGIFHFVIKQREDICNQTVQEKIDLKIFKVIVQNNLIDIKMGIDYDVDDSEKD